MRTAGAQPERVYREHGRGLAVIVAVLRERWEVSPSPPAPLPPGERGESYPLPPGGGSAQERRPGVEGANVPPLRETAERGDPLTNLPAGLTRFIGREREMAEVRQLLGTTRLLTLTGAGGCGKTRLALEVAGRLLAEYPDGVWLVELAPVADPSLVPRAVALALSVREQPGQPMLKTLLGDLRSRRLLLVLDNCEHLVEACASLVEAALRGGAHLRVLATSREALRVPGEVSWRVPSLSTPPADVASPPDELVRYEAVRLFVERAGAAAPGFGVTERNASAVAQVCRRLDGTALAIELAAARVKVLTVEQIAERLDDRFRLLTGGARTALPRHRTLRALIDWSYGLLSDAERALLRRLSVFSGGFALEAAGALSGWSKKATGGEGDGATGR